MKFRLVFEGAEKRLEIIPENPGEAQTLAGVIDPNAVRDDTLTKDAQVQCDVSSDRVPYRKVQRLVVVL